VTGNSSPPCCASKPFVACCPFSAVEEREYGPEPAVGAVVTRYVAFGSKVGSNELSPRGTP